MSGIEVAKPPARRTRRPIDGATAQEHLLRAAEELFYKEGVRTVGVEAVVERAGVNKMSLYRQFSSKDELILAYLERMDACFFERLDTSAAKHPGQPKAQLIQYFVDLAERATQRTIAAARSSTWPPNSRTRRIRRANASRRTRNS